MKIDWRQVEAALPTLQPTQGGFTNAQRGIITLNSGEKLFVKQAVDDQTATWVKSEKRAYHWLAAHDYQYAPLIIAEGEDGFALPDLSHLDWSNEWSIEKIEVALKAMDALAMLSEAAVSSFEQYDDVNHWPSLPHSVDKYEMVSSGEQASTYVGKFLKKGKHRDQLTAAAENHPEHGNVLVHMDVRADNFCYDVKTKRGYLVDWNWLCLANRALDTNGLLVSVAQRGFDVLGHTKDHLDRPSLASLAGFWLAEAAKSANSPQDDKRHKQQFKAAVTALTLYEQIQ
jgi:hypothetical protein